MPSCIQSQPGLGGASKFRFPLLKHPRSFLQLFMSHKLPTWPCFPSPSSSDRVAASISSCSTHTGFLFHTVDYQFLNMRRQRWWHFWKVPSPLPLIAKQVQLLRRFFLPVELFLSRQNPQYIFLQRQKLGVLLFNLLPLSWPRSERPRIINLFLMYSRDEGSQITFKVYFSFSHPASQVLPCV